MLSFSKSLVLLTLSVVLSGVQAYPRPHPSSSQHVCHEDRELRTLERFSNYADQFCPEFLANTGKYPPWLDEWNKKKVSSACSCYEKTATSLTTPSTVPVTGTLSLSSTAPAALSSVFASTTGSAISSPSLSVVASSGSAPVATGSSRKYSTKCSSSRYPPTGIPTGGYIPSGTASGVYYPSGTLRGSSGSVPLKTGTAPIATGTSLASVPNRGVSPLSSILPSLPISLPIITASSTASSSTPTGTSSLPAGDNYPPQPPGAGPGKRGLIYNATTQDGWSDLFKYSKYATYGSNGGLDRGTQLDESFSYVPTLVVDSNLNNNDWNTDVPVLIEGGTKALFASNEPDSPTGANLTPDKAATVFKKYMQPYVGTVQLSTPAISGPSGLPYLENFIASCTACNFNFVNVHFVQDRSVATVDQYVQALKTFITTDVPAVRDKYPQTKDLPIFVGNWWLNGASADEGAELMDGLLEWLDGEESVLAYQAGGLFVEGGFVDAALTGLTAAGQKYSTWPTS